MLFTSYSFLLFIITVFISYYLTPKKYQWILLLCASYLFYGLVSIDYLGYIIVTTVSTYFVSLKIHEINKKKKSYLIEHKELSRKEKKEYKKEVKKYTKKFLTFGMLLNFGLLGATKYTNFIIGNINSIITNFGTNGTLSFID